MEKIIHKLISEFTKGIDTYTHNGSTWLIFTGSKQWVIELTEEKTLWYNYTFFKSVFAYSSFNVAKIALSDLRAKIIYSVGAGCGAVSGLWLINQMV